MSDKRIILCILIGFLTLSTLPATAHNGRVALAFPLEGITVDGDLSDWPSEAVRYPILSTEYGLPPGNAGDFQGSFRLGYNLATNSLYLAVEVDDESIIAETTSAPRWDTQDGCEVYLDLAHGERQSAAVQHFIYGSTGQRSFSEQTLKVVKAAWQRHGDGHCYEWSLDLGNLELAGPGTTIGFDVAICDRDSDGSFSWMTWGKGVGKLDEVNRRGDVILVGEQVPTGSIQGGVRWQDTGESMSGAMLRVHSQAIQALWVKVETDRQGRYELPLPAGAYRVEAESGGGLIESKTVELDEGISQDVSFAVHPTPGRQVALGPGTSVEAGGGLRQGLWHSFCMPDGLPNGLVQTLLQDDQGILWIGTGDGLARYDGQRFTTFTTDDGLAGNRIRALLLDSDDDLWIGTDDGISRYDGESFTSFSAREGLANGQTRALLQDRQGNIWIGTDDGLSRYDGRHFINFSTDDGLAGNQIRSLVQDRDGKLWIGTLAGVCRYDGRPDEGFTCFTTRDGLAGNQVRALLADDDGNLWFGTDAGVSRFDGEHFTTFTVGDGLVGNQVRSLVQDRDGNIWIGTWDGGVSRYDGERFVSFTAHDGLASDQVDVLLEDREGILWVGTLGGLSRYDGGYFANFTTDDGLADDIVWTVVEDHEGDLWIGTNGGLCRYDGEQFTNFTIDDGLANDIVWAIREDRRGILWIGTQGGLSRFDGERFTRFTIDDGLAHDEVSSLVEDRDGDLWIGTWGGGISRFDGERFIKFTTQDGLAHNVVSSLVEDRDGDLWIGTWGGGISRFDGERFTTFPAESGLAGNQVWSMLEDGEGGIWIGTQSGLSRFDGEQFTTYTVQDGLVSNQVRALSRDDRGHLWIGTNGGVSRFDGAAFQNLLRRDGLAGNDVRALYHDSRGHMWVTTYGSGVSRYRPRRTPPAVWLNDIVADRRYGPVFEIDLPSSQPFLAFEFQALSFKTRPEAMFFRYRLQSHDPDWRMTRLHRIEYQDLPTGDYVFEVQAIDRDLTLSSTPAAVKVRVHLPYVQIGIRVSLFLALALIVWLIVQIVQRNRRLRQAHDELEMRVEERTTELADALRQLQDTQSQLVLQEKMASLGNLAAGVAHEINNPVGAVSSAADVSRRCIERIVEILDRHEEFKGDQILQQALDLLESNNQIATTGTERIARIVQSLRSFARLDESDLQEADIHEGLDSTLTLLYHKTKARIEVHRRYGEVPAIFCYPQELNQVFMNLLNNAIQAIDGRGEIHISTSASEREVCVEISDTGQGVSAENVERIFEPGFTTKREGEGTGLGLSISSNIIRKHRGRIEVESEVGQGTTFRIVLPRD